MGNRITAARWVKLLRGLRHSVVVRSELSRGDRWDVLVALHAKKSAAAVARASEASPRRPVIVALTGTDLYGPALRDPEAQATLDRADRLVVLTPDGVRALPRRVRARARVVLQSAERPRGKRPRARDVVRVAVVGHLRDEKDPFCAAEASRLLPGGSRIDIVHAGRALTKQHRARALQEQDANSRYRWLGEVSPRRARRLIAESSVLVLTSRVEGGANVLSEAIVAGTPVIASRIPSSVGVLGPRYPGFFRTGDRKALARLLSRFERSADFRAALRAACRDLRSGFSPARERDSWRRLLRELTREVATSRRQLRARAGRP